MLGGRAAEKLVFDEYSAGAENDLMQATRLARRMVTAWGMSERLGPVAYRTSEEHPFLGKEIYEQREFSEHSAQLIDEEVARILHEAAERASDLLGQQRAQLETLATALEEQEVLDEQEIEELLGPSINKRTAESNGRVVDVAPSDNKGGDAPLAGRQERLPPPGESRENNGRPPGFSRNFLPTTTFPLLATQPAPPALTPTLRPKISLLFSARWWLFLSPFLFFQTILGFASLKSCPPFTSSQPSGFAPGPPLAPFFLPRVFFVVFLLFCAALCPPLATRASKQHLTEHPGTVFFAAGTRTRGLNREVNDKEFDVALHVVFKSRAAHDEYQTAPRHVKFIEESKPNWAKVRVFDADVE